MKITFDDRQLRKLSKKLTDAGREFGKAELKKTLKDALEPVLLIARAEVPYGSRLNRSTQTFVRKSGKTVRDGTYDKGGATRRDLRIKIVDGVGEEIIRGLVGVNKSRGHVGWRAHFVTLGTANRVTKRTGANRGQVTANNFLDRAERIGIPLAVSSLSASAQKIVRDILARV